jgi:hypothetical protein
MRSITGSNRTLNASHSSALLAQRLPVPPPTSPTPPAAFPTRAVTDTNAEVEVDAEGAVGTGTLALALALSLAGAPAAPFARRPFVPWVVELRIRRGSLPSALGASSNIMSFLSRLPTTHYFESSSLLPAANHRVSSCPFECQIRPYRKSPNQPKAGKFVG